ncbi:MAG: hypothetical protein U0N26_06250, partial [Faecalibacterium prausnitzii]
HLTERKNQPRATSARTSLKKNQPCDLARAARKPLDRRKKHPPRHRRASHLKEKTNPAATPHQVVITDPQERKRVSSE